MLKLQIRFESSWTNSFFEESGDLPLFTSGHMLSESTKDIVAVDFDSKTEIKNAPRLSYLQTLQSANPKLLYKVPVSFKRTVQGVLSRLVGEVRRLRDLDEDHLSFRAINNGTFELKIEHEHSQTSKLTTYEINDIKTGGAGLITNNVLYGNSLESKYLFGHLDLSLAEMCSSIDDIVSLKYSGNWVPESPSVLIDRLNLLMNEQNSSIKSAKKEFDKGCYQSPYLITLRSLAKIFPVDAKNELIERSTSDHVSTIENGGLDMWEIAGALIVAKIKALTEDEKNSYIKSKALTPKGNLSGLAMSGKVGRITPKDVFSFASGSGATSNKMPYSVYVPVIDGEKKIVYIPTGILKKTGDIEFTICNSPELEEELYTAIQNASVGPFHFGKKGVAYVKDIELY